MCAPGFGYTGSEQSTRNLLLHLQSGRTRGSRHSLNSCASGYERLEQAITRLEEYNEEKKFIDCVEQLFHYNYTANAFVYAQVDCLAKSSLLVAPICCFCLIKPRSSPKLESTSNPLHVSSLPRAHTLLIYHHRSSRMQLHKTVPAFFERNTPTNSSSLASFLESWAFWAPWHLLAHC